MPASTGYINSWIYRHDQCSATCCHIADDHFLLLRNVFASLTAAVVSLKGVATDPVWQYRLDLFSISCAWGAVFFSSMEHYAHKRAPAVEKRALESEALWKKKCEESKLDQLKLGESKV